ncbi:UDP-glucose dehydrogenase family protein [Ureibacillus chungkukjangi]|uniref:UDP-glucose 6-dehydrogenase n=1 Tax=Ureibacillus chungkukjangi TaxID=1202712 RepID=A0A318TQH7_9BACL|nr:UDP-glucose/GDP-mannose dehydrogenase family protein [Ureibacillus chungkukjangi]MCM3386870.1 UDP-glucose/GDP-mannose dehydrogenase family protein [Ureibacillus chungkukjangi]PYF06050.1 UDPglucose 6-dehydrogenase [Ureibacillus chungkukjangi]
MKIAVVGTGYVGLVTGVSLSEIGHQVWCIDIDTEKIEMLKKGKSPIYEPGLSELMQKNIAQNRLTFTTKHSEGFQGADVIYIAVGTPENEDGSANLTYVEDVALKIVELVTQDTIVVIKSTVPVGTNNRIQDLINQHKERDLRIEIVSNPEFLKEGTAIYDSFHGDRIVIGASSKYAFKILEEINKPFGIPIFQTDIRSAEMIKYAANAFLATKISFINEIANICERVEADVEEVARGIGMDQRIGNKFLKAGIGYGGSCFPKDTKALLKIAGVVDYDFELLKGVIMVNKNQQELLLQKLNNRFDTLKDKRIAILGLAFKPNTDDMREAASIVITEELVNQGANVVVYDPVAMENAKKVLVPSIKYASSVEEALQEAEVALILTEWDEIKKIDIESFRKMKTPIVFDGRNCFDLESLQKSGIEYHSIGRPVVKPEIANALF